jgi:hypothetical protein
MEWKAEPLACRRKGGQAGCAAVREKDLLNFKQVPERVKRALCMKASDAATSGSTSLLAMGSMLSTAPRTRLRPVWSVCVKV